jgi:hypothetical protein
MDDTEMAQLMLQGELSSPWSLSYFTFPKLKISELATKEDNYV